MTPNDIKIELRKLTYQELREIYHALMGFLKNAKISKKERSKNIEKMNKARLEKMALQKALRNQSIQGNILK